MLNLLPKTLPVRWHLMVFAVLILLPQLILGLALGSWYSSAERRRVEDSAVNVAEAVRSQLDRELEAVKAALQALATSPNVERGDFEALRVQALELLKFRGTAIGVRDRTHRPVMNTLAPPHADLPATTHPAVIAADERVFSSGDPAVSDLYLGSVLARPFVLVDVPLRLGGEIRYVLNMAIAPQAIRDTLLGAGVPDGWVVSILDGNNQVIARSRDQDAFIGRTAPTSFTASAVARAGKVPGVTALDGTTVFTAYDTLDSSRWRVAVSVPEAVLNAPLRNLVLTLAAVVVLALATSAVLAHLYSRWLEREFRSLQAMATSTGSSGAPARAPGIVRELESVAAALDDADRSLKARDRHRDLLLAELNHRVRNTLAVTLSIVNQTIRGSGAGEALARKTTGRIMALSRAHDLLSSSEWSSIALSDLVARTAEQEQLPIEHQGDDILLRPEVVAPLAQALHELAVNQRAHGRPGGRIVLRSHVGEGQLRIEWLPPAGEDILPWTSGFGFRLVRLCLERQLFGTIERLDAAGMSAVLPLDFVIGSKQPAEPFAARLGIREATSAPVEGA